MKNVVERLMFYNARRTIKTHNIQVYQTMYSGSNGSQGTPEKNTNMSGQKQSRIITNQKQKVQTFSVQETNKNKKKTTKSRVNPKQNKSDFMIEEKRTTRQLPSIEEVPEEYLVV